MGEPGGLLEFRGDPHVEAALSSSRPRRQDARKILAGKPPALGGQSEERGRRRAQNVRITLPVKAFHNRILRANSRSSLVSRASWTSFGSVHGHYRTRFAHAFNYCTEDCKFI